MSTPSPAPGCPLCGKSQAKQYRPFCSRRCADVDLHRWLTGRYAIPAAEAEGADGLAAEDESAD